MPQHIGIVACSAEGAALCYRTICLEGADLLGSHNHPEISMHGHPFAAYVKCIEANDWPGVAELLLTSAEKLAKAGADFLMGLTGELTNPRFWVLSSAAESSDSARPGTTAKLTLRRSCEPLWTTTPPLSIPTN